MSASDKTKDETDVDVRQAGVTSPANDAPIQAPPANSWTVLVQGVALFSDGYNVQIISYMTTVLAKLYPKQLTSSVKTQLSNSILIGEVVGMILFGFLIDRFGRRVGVVATTLFLVLGITLATASSGSTPHGLFWMMIISRGVAGVGAGGEYAVCTAQAIESADVNDKLRRKRGLLVAVCTNLAIVSGFTSSAIVSLIVIKAYNNKASQGLWRICFGIGIIMPLTIFFFRMRLLNSAQYQRHSIKHNIPYKLAVKRYWKPMIGCCGAWFMYDFVVYPFNLLAPVLVAGFSKKPTLLESVGWSGFINAFAIPGAIIGAFLVDRIGRKRTYILGWSVTTVLGFIIGGARRPLSHVFPLFVVLFAIFQSSLSIGPGDCNFLVSSESFPTPIRGHFLGFAAAFGKAGGAIGTTVLTIALNSFEDPVKGQQVLYLIGSCISLVGICFVYFLIPVHNETLEEEDVKFREYLESEGYDTSAMGLSSKE